MEQEDEVTIELVHKGECHHRWHVKKNIAGAIITIFDSVSGLDVDVD